MRSRVLLLLLLLKLQWRPCSASVELGRGMATSSDGSSTSYSGGGNGAEKVNEVDSMMAIKELLAACPMTEAQRTRFVDTVTVNSHVSMPAKGKPSEEVVALLQAKRVQRDEVKYAHVFSESIYFNGSVLFVLSGY